MSISESEAKLKLSILNSNAIELDRIDTVAQLTNMGLPQEVITRIEELWEKTKIVGGQVIHIGKVILAEIMKFIKENQNLAVGMAIGAAIGALTNLIPFIGPLLAPLVAAVSIFVGGIIGHGLDESRDPRDGFVGISQELIIFAKKFFELFADIINALQGEFAQE